jgi:hypothetical protein
MKWAGHVASMGEMINVYKILDRKSSGKTPLGRSRRRWEDNVRLELREIGWKAWTGLIWLRIVIISSWLL